MNGATHELVAKVTARLILAHGFAPRAAQFLTPTEQRLHFVSCASLPDRVREVEIGGRTDVLGHGLSSFQHFPAGYRWRDDPSLSVAGAIASEVADVVSLHVGACGADPRPPLSGLLVPSPIEAALARRPFACVGTFRFPSAGESAAYYSKAAQQWGQDGNAVGWARCTGYTLHFAMDSIIPHHAWGALLFGHEEFEAALETSSTQHVLSIEQADGWGIMADEISSEIADPVFESCASVGDLCAANAAWVRRRFGDARHLSECSDLDALAILVRAVASCVRACELMA